MFVGHMGGRTRAAARSSFARAGGPKTMPGDARPPFPPGGGPHHAQNPGGRPRKTPEMREAEELARKCSPAAIRRLIDLMGCDDPHAAIKAANSVLDRAFGKPAQAITGPDGAPLDLGGADSARLEFARIMAELAGRREVAIEAQVIERPALPAKDGGK